MHVTFSMSGGRGGRGRRGGEEAEEEEGLQREVIQSKEEEEEEEEGLFRADAVNEEEARYRQPTSWPSAGWKAHAACHRYGAGHHEHTMDN